MVTKGYGFSIDDIDMMNPELLKPYVDAYKAEWKQRDMEMYMWFGRYATSVLVTAIDATFGKGNSKYVKETCYDSIEKIKDFINYDKLESYRDFTGLRNEEDYLITEDGARFWGTKVLLLQNDDI